MPCSGVARLRNLSSASISTFLLANAFVWYLAAFKFLQDTSSSKGFSDNALISIIALNFVAFAFSALIGISFINRFQKRLVLIKYWMIAGLPISTLFAVIDLGHFMNVMVLSGILGSYFGLGMPTFAGFFAASTEPRNRAKLGGTAILLIVLSFPTLTIVGLAETYLTSSVLAAWLALGLFFVIYFKPVEMKALSKNQITYRTVFSNKTFLLYIVPWLMFSLVNDLTAQIISNNFRDLPAYFSGNYLVLENVLAGACAIICGYLADKKGRKRLALVGFALLGIGYATLGLLGSNFYVAWFYVCADGVSWGAFTMLFLTTLWGDIAQDKNSEKYYLLGVLPYLCSTFIGATVDTFLSSTISMGPTVFSFASFFLFAATLPLFYAPETLSDRIIKDTDLNSYITKALEKVEKENKKQAEPWIQLEKEKETPKEYVEFQIANKIDEEEDEKEELLAEQYH